METKISDFLYKKVSLLKSKGLTKEASHLSKISNIIEANGFGKIDVKETATPSPVTKPVQDAKKLSEDIKNIYGKNKQVYDEFVKALINGLKFPNCEE